jgi:VWFA-related protein
MTRRAIWIGSATLAVCGVATMIVAAQTQRPPTFRAGAVLVTVDAYPQKDGRTVEGLTAADFEVFEDGKPQKIENFEFVRIEPSLSESERKDPNTQAESLEQAADPHNRVFVVYLDALHVTVEGSHDIRRPLVETLNRIVAPNDLFGVMTQNIQPRHLVLGRRLIAVEEQLTRYWPWGERHSITHDPTDPVEDALTQCFALTPQGGPWLVNDSGASRRLDRVLIDRRREDRTLTSLEDLTTYLSTLREARTVVMLVTDGWLLFEPNSGLANQSGRFGAPPPTQPVTIGPGGRLGVADKLDPNLADRGLCNGELLRLAQMDNARRFRDLLTRASRANLSVYPITPAGLAVFDTPISDPDGQAFNLQRDMNRVTTRLDGLRTLAENTDGIAIVNTNDLSKGMKRIVDDVSAYYLLGYYSTNTKNDGRYRRIEVQMKPPGLSTRARRGYFAPAEGPANATTRAAPPPGSATTAAASNVEAAFGSLGRLKATTALYSYGVMADGEVRLAVEIGSSQLADGRWAQGADVEVTLATGGAEASGTTKARIEAPARGALVRIPLSAGATGPWRAEIKVRNGAETLEDRTEVRTVSSRLAGEPLIYRGTPAATSPLRAAADFQYRRTERVHIEVPLAGPVDRREARLLGRNGQPLAVPVSVTERDVLGKPGLAADLTLAPLSAGDYVIEITVGNGANVEKKLVAIRVMQ